LVEHADVIAVEERESESDDRGGEDQVDVETSSLQHVIPASATASLCQRQGRMMA